MKLNFLWGIVFLLAVTFGHSEENPKIYFPEPYFNLGKVNEGPDVSHKFYFYNKGNKNLKIKITYGDAATMKLKNWIYPTDGILFPGQRGWVNITFHTNGRPGHNVKIVQIPSDDPANPISRLKIEMTVVREVDVQPERLYLYESQLGKPNESTKKVLGPPGIAFKILSAKSEKGVMVVGDIKPCFDEKEKRQGNSFDLLLPGTLPIGSFKDDILIETNFSKKRKVTLNVLGEVVNGKR